MNFMGMGMPEMGVVMLVAFLVLGPSRAIDMARTAGKLIRDIQRTFKDVASAISLDQPEQSTSRRDFSPAPDREDAPPSQDPSPSSDREEDPPPKAEHE